MRAQFDPVNPQQQNFGGGGGPHAARDPDVVPAAQVAEQLDQFLVGRGAVGRINDAGREHGQIRAFNNRTFDVAKAVPTVVMRNEDYGRISRLLADGTPVEVELNIVNRTIPEGATVYNVVAEIPGSDKAQEVVMLGGHLDSWHCRHRRHRQRDRLGDDARGDSHPAGDRRQAAPHDPGGAVER